MARELRNEREAAFMLQAQAESRPARPAAQKPAPRKPAPWFIRYRRFILGA